MGKAVSGELAYRETCLVFYKAEILYWHALHTYVK